MDFLYNINFALQGIKFRRRTNDSYSLTSSCTSLAYMTRKVEILASVDSL